MNALIRAAWTAALLAIVLAVASSAGSSDDRSDLSLAIRLGDLRAVRAIVERSPGLLRSADDSGFTPLHIAATAGRVEIVDYLLAQGCDVEARNAEGRTPLFQTVPLARGEAFVRLLEKGANLNALDGQGGTILQFALTWRRPAMVALILSRGFRLDVRPTAARQMLDDAANAGIESLTNALISRGAPIDVAPRDGTTLLHSAARGGLPGLVLQLLKHGAKVNERDLHGFTPLHLAASYGRDDAALALLGAGADIEARLPDGRTAHDLAAASGYPETATLLAGKGAKDRAANFPPLAGLYLEQADPGPVPRVFAPGIVSLEGHETNIAFAPDGRELCFSGISLDEQHRWIRFMRVVDGRWTAPASIAFASEGADFEVSYASGGRQLLFSSNRGLVEGSPPKRDYDIWAVDRTADGWGRPRNLGPGVNGPSNEFMPTTDRDGTLYFERFGLNVARPRDGGYPTSEPLSIENAVNAGHPFAAPDGTYLLFDARRPGSSAGGPSGVLFVSFRTKDGGWSPAVRLFEPASARDYESCPTVSPDGRYLFFGRDHDIYWVSAQVIEARRPAR